MDIDRAADSAADTLFGLSPLTQLVLGVGLLAGGVAALIAHAGAGLVVGLEIACVTLGPLVAINGYHDLRKGRDLRRQTEIVRERGEQLVADVIAAKSSGRNALELLRDAGITDMHIRQSLIRAAAKRMQPPT